MTRAGQRQTRLAVYEPPPQVRHEPSVARVALSGAAVPSSLPLVTSGMPEVTGTPRHDSPEPTPRASFSSLPGADSIDESSLLAETEDLLATLDVSAFVRSGLAPPATVGTSRTAGGTTSARGAFNISVSKPETITQMRRGLLLSVSEHSTDKMRAGPKDSRREEIQQLRKDASSLEVQLARLRYHNQSCLLVRDKRKHIWQELAARQCRLRQLAEAENQQLKNMLHQVLRVNDPYQFESHFGSKDALIDSLPNYLQGPWRRAVDSMSRDVELVAVFESLLGRLDAGFAELDAVFRENGMDQALTEPRSYAEKKTRRLGETCQYVELVDVRLSPFHWQDVGNATWQCNKAWYLKDDSYVYRCRDRPDDTLAVAYRMKHSSGGGGGGNSSQQSMGFTLAMRRYIQPDRVVFLCANRIDGENELAGVSTTDIGYLVMSNMDVLSESDTSPVTVVRSCMQIFPQSEQNATGLAKVNGLLNLMVGAFEEDVRFIRQEVDSLLLQQASATNSLNLAETSTGALQNGESQALAAPRIAFGSSDLVR